MRDLMIVANWKCNKTVSESKEFLTEFVKKVKELPAGRSVVICPPTINIPTCSEILKGTKIELGAQNFYTITGGAYTGETCINMLKEFDVKYVIVGHSERKMYFNETSNLLNAKTFQALTSGLRPIVCIGEKQAECSQDEVAEILYEQINDIVFSLEAEQIEKIIWAYEPIWAIGSDKSATPKQAEFAGNYIKGVLNELYDINHDKIVVLYGGSVNPTNAADFCNCNFVDGLLVGGASLDVKKFAELATSHYVKLNALVDSNIKYKRSSNIKEKEEKK